MVREWRSYRPERMPDSDIRPRVSCSRAAVGATLAIGKEVLDLSDSYQVLSNKIRVVTDDETAMARVRDQLFDIAERTRSSNEGVVTVYTRLAASAKELGRTDQQLLQFTESLSKAVKISGATSAEASAGLIQLSQGLASGALRGDELRSVLEQLPAVADVIAQGLGVTRGELRKMGEDGKITANAVIDAFEKASGSIDERFGKSVATTSDLMQVLHNEIERTVGSLTEQINLLPTLAKGFEAAGAAIRQMGEAAHVAINYFKAMDAAIPEWVKKGLLPGLNGNAGKAAQVAFSGLTAVPWDKIATDNLSVIDATIKHALAVQAEQQKIIDGQEILDALRGAGVVDRGALRALPERGPGLGGERRRGQCHGRDSVHVRRLRRIGSTHQQRR